jgi:hypothetical protein
MKLKLLVFLLSFSMHSAWAQTDQKQDNMFLLISEYYFLTFDSMIIKDYLNLLQNKGSISTEEFKRKEQNFLCAEMVIYSQYKEFLKNIEDKTNERLVIYMNKKSKELGKRFEQEKPQCGGQEVDVYLMGLYDLMNFRTYY